MNKNYTANDIETLSFRDAIRSRVAMYMGSADNMGVLQCIREIITNSIDEATMGFGKKITVELFKCNRVRITDEGRGCPFGKREDGTEALEAIYTMAHSGAKFNNKVFQNVAGMNGIGAKGVALSSDDFIVTSFREGKRAVLKLENGLKTEFLLRINLSRQIILLVQLLNLYLHKKFIILNPSKLILKKLKKCVVIGLICLRVLVSF